MSINFIKKFSHPLRGIVHAFKSEISIKIEIGILFILIIFVYYFWPIEQFQIFALVISYALLLITELVNTSIEKALERLHPELHELIGVSKDVAAAAVLISAFLFAFVVITITLSKLHFL